ncbi:hypothetical protein PR202_gb14595 [Eleusine coracana subsp. coracana]|uniref:RING-type domain-containing protein n=1 Tax=Eleusine coracana subsp. coracana TaxID=191504 RepID=A0AAV5EVR1_ELECO|nr:hypothetical protein QOZ80_4BG0337430 [Eleusine coracana subsp. coracana]GJN26646.1 hypothetical protein PR202_gb14595 [Eleusine coracana subsp. coracana]
MMPVPRQFSSDDDHSYELPLRRNLLLLLDLLDILRFIAGVLLDRLGIAPPCHVDVLLPAGGQSSWGGGGDLVVDAAAAERILETALRASGIISSSARAPPPVYRRRRRRVEDDDEDVNCAICLTGLDAGGGIIAELCACSHAFHAACIDAWVSSGGEAATCPLCRAPVSPTAWELGRAVQSWCAATARPAD